MRARSRPQSRQGTGAPLGPAPPVVYHFDGTDGARSPLGRVFACPAIHGPTALPRRRIDYVVDKADSVESLHERHECNYEDASKWIVASGEYPLAVTLVSVVIPTTATDFLAEAVNSVLSQKRPDFEVLIVTNAPNLNLSDLPDDERLRFLDQPREGKAFAVNLAAFHARVNGWPSWTRMTCGNPRSWLPSWTPSPLGTVWRHA